MDLPCEPADEVGVANLQERAVSNPAGQAERHGAVTRNPNWKVVCLHPVKLQRTPLVLHRLAFNKCANDSDRLLEILH